MTETIRTKTRFVCDIVVQTARLMVGVPDYDNYVAQPSAAADHDAQGVLPRTPGGALRHRQRALPRLLLKRRLMFYCRNRRRALNGSLTSKA